MLPSEKFKANLPSHLSDLASYIEATYSQHYTNPDVSDIQVLDFWTHLGISRQTYQATALKYLARYGKKEGNNKKDLLKSLHFILLLLNENHPITEIQTNANQPSKST